MGIRAELPVDASASGLARTLVRQAIADEGIRQDALIVVSELVANAFRHGEPPLRLDLLDEQDGQPPGTLRIQVSNQQRTGSTEVPTLTTGGRADGMGGRGMDLVDRLAADWGWELQDRRMTVWARLDPGSR